MAGTQALDASWNALKKYRPVPQTKKNNNGKANLDLFVWARASILGAKTNTRAMDESTSPKN